MAANTSPIFTKQPAFGQDKLLTGNTAKDAASGTVYTVFSADATNGSRVDKAILQPLGTNVATVVRLFINNGGATTTATNNTMIKDVSMAATTNSETAGVGNTEVALNLPLKPGYKILATIGTTVAAGINCTIIGGDY